MKSDDGQVEDDDSKKIGRFAVEVTKVLLCAVHLWLKCSRSGTAHGIMDGCVT